jgi:putative spermidine/putrescine transport system ATP-binding protein/spermidine/putrescine transport system ATP-binding protein
MSAADVVLKGVGKRFGPVVAVADIDLAVGVGEFVALLGPSGCGKTTTLRMIAGLEEPSSGDILVKGRRINDIAVHRRNFGMVFQDLALFPHMTAFDNIAFGLKYRKVPRHEVERRVREALDIVRLPHVGERLPRQLSGGQQQRVAVARAIIIDPDLLLFDEPLSALDANLREEMRIELKRIHRTFGITTVFVTHDQAEALSMADRVVLMREGHVEQEGPPDQLYRAPKTEFVARFFGHVNEVSGTVTGQQQGIWRVALDSGVAIAVMGQNLSMGARTRLLFRSERARVERTFPDEAMAPAIPGTIVSSDYMGMLVRYVVEIGEQQVIVTQAVGDQQLRAGETVHVCIPADAWMTFLPPPR